jgi:hypothetical protein
MQIHKEFSPVRITLENSEELEALRWMVGLCKETIRAREDAETAKVLKLFDKYL